MKALNDDDFSQDEYAAHRPLREKGPVAGAGGHGGYGGHGGLWAGILSVCLYWDPVRWRVNGECLLCHHQALQVGRVDHAFVDLHLSKGIVNLTGGELVAEGHQ